VKAAVFKALGQPLTVEERPDPTPGPGEVVVKVGRCGICGSDLHMTEEPAFDLAPESVLGHEYAGEIVALGPEVETLKKGDRVAVFPLLGCGKCAQCLSGEPAWCDQFRLDFGGYAEYAVATERQCLKLPSTLSLEDGALVEPLAVGLHGAHMANIAPGDTALVIGAGPIGLAAAFWTRRLGAGKIAVTALENSMANIAGHLGADAFLPADDTLDENVRKALGGPPDIVIEAAGAHGVLNRAIGHVKKRGTVVMLGLCTGFDHYEPFGLMHKEARIQPSAFYSWKEFAFAAEMLDRGHVEPEAMITDTVSLTEMPETFEALRQRTNQCKVMVTCG